MFGKNLNIVRDYHCKRSHSLNQGGERLLYGGGGKGGSKTRRGGRLQCKNYHFKGGKH